MKKKLYIFELLIIACLFSTAIYLDSMKPIKKSRHFAFNSQYDYSLPKQAIKSPSKSILNNYQYYRVLDSTNITKRTYFNFNVEEKIELIKVSKSLHWALVKVESIQGIPTRIKYKFIPLSNLHQTLLPIHLNA
jgi:hypothetical protein